MNVPFFENFTPILFLFVGFQGWQVCTFMSNFGEPKEREIFNQVYSGHAGCGLKEMCVIAKSYHL